MSVCTLYSFSYSYPSLLFPYPFITFYIFPYFNKLLWQIVAGFIHQIFLTLLNCLIKLASPSICHIHPNSETNSGFQFRFYISYLYSGLSTTHTINNKKHLQIFMNCGSSAVDSFQRTKQESNGNKDCSVL